MSSSIVLDFCVLDSCSEDGQVKGRRGVKEVMVVSYIWSVELWVTLVELVESSFLQVSVKQMWEGQNFM
jgi:hypothetical protein